ncbi:hypothetical protein DT076_16680 [Desertihabitans brevis]|uniref:Uncharacterized protein n=1 Tax=Desertihabitans brevis TaxID=2268447 RepID=A0A367YTC6_9ACTN|nr:hypothetical protein [Desertihabitans brevis]RCK68282.1 hypothetical protein DT076_16680 [Desertihabitans brevis]
MNLFTAFEAALRAAAATEAAFAQLTEDQRTRVLDLARTSPYTTAEAIHRVRAADENTWLADVSGAFEALTAFGITLDQPHRCTLLPRGATEPFLRPDIPARCEQAARTAVLL